HDFLPLHVFLFPHSLINKIKPGLIKRVNRLPTPIAGLDNLNVFLKACGKLGLKEAQLFHPGDLQDLSTRATVKHQETDRRLKNVLITIYWLGRRAQSDRLYDGPYLNFKAFEGLLGTALYKALQESSSQRSSTARDSGFGDSWYSEREKLHHLGGRGGGRPRRDDSLDSLNSMGSRPHSDSSDTTLKGSSEGEETPQTPSFTFSRPNKDSKGYRRITNILPSVSADYNRFLPTKDKPSGYVPPPLRKKRSERNEDNRRSLNYGSMEDEGQITRYPKTVCTESLFRDTYEDSEDEDDEVGHADPVQDDLYARKMGLKPQPAGSVAFDKFLPKFWTPEEDVHVQKIKLGSQRRPWYKKMQGFSPHTQPHTLPQLPKKQSSLLETPPLIFAPLDPTSGPRLVKGERWPLLGRQEPPDHFDYDSINPDLENDDMFARRTLSFQSNIDLALVKSQFSVKRRLCTSSPQLNIVTQQHRPGDAEESEFPNIEQDDVVYRKEKTMQAQQQRPLSGAPDNYSPMPIPEPWALPPELKARLLCPPCPLTHDTKADTPNEPEKRMNTTTDDMLIRKLRDCSDQSQPSLRGPSARHRSPSVPASCSEGDLQKWQAIREASQLRHRKKVLVERLAALKSKSTSDIDADAMALRQLRFEELQKYREQIKESDDKWQDDLTKWKNRRRSVNSDIAKKKEEREKIEQITYGDDRRSKTFKEMQEESTNTASIPSSAQKAPEPKPPLLGTQAKAEAPPLALHKEEPQLNSMQPKPPEFSWVSSSLPRSYQKSDSLRLTSVVTPRPFGTQSSRISSLPRAQTVSPSDGSFILSLSELSKSLQLLGKLVNFLVTSVPSRYQQFMTSEDEAQSSSAQSSEEEEKDEVKEDERPKETSITIVCRLFLFACQENFCEMRVNLNQKPNSSRDFGFQSNWDSKGVRVSSIQPGSSAEMCQLQVGDEVLTINGHKVAEMSYTEWKTCMDQALREGSLVMDVRRHGQNSESSHKSHHSLILTVMRAVQCVSHGNAVPHSFLFSIFHVESEPISLKNLKRRSEFFEQGKNKEEERRRQEKWQMEQERLLQVYTKSHLSTLIAHLEVNSNNVGTHFPLSSSSAPQTAPPAWEEEERKRKEEQERQRQEEERKKREEQERDLLRLEEQRKRREVQEEQKRRQEAAEQERREKEKALEQQQQWSAINIFTCSSADFKSYQPLSQAELERQQILDKMKKKTSLQRDGSWIRQGSTTTPTSKGESDPQFMRRGESLDNLDYDSHRSSWSPRSNSFVQNYSQTQHGLYSNSSGYGGGYRAQRPVSGFMYRSSGPQCLLFDFTFSVTVFCVYLPTQSITRVSGSQSQLFILQSRSVSGKNICSLCDTPLGKGAAMIIESLGLYFHLDCFKCIDCNSSLGGSEAGAEVRIRNQQLYCNSCYIQAKSKQPTSM
uniref:LIM domain 7a n=1 Tax=Oryzias sinensis TaxID=183150 RepID=A0A8C7YEB4_9TELE